MAQFEDVLVSPGRTDLPREFFDRFMLNLHAADDGPFEAILGFGVYPGRGVVDGYLGVLIGDEQRNLRFSTDARKTCNRAGPLRYEIVEANREWGLALADNATGLSGELRWTARAPAWTSTVEVDNVAGGRTSFEHLVQSGRWSGHLDVDGTKVDVTGWFGQRDRSRGVRTMSGGQGLHLWFQAQFPDRTVGFLLVEDRAGGVLVLEGAVVTEAGERDDVVAVSHDLRFDDGLDLRSGRIVVGTAAERTYPIDIDASARGMYMAGLGYGGWHGQPRGRDHVERDVFALDGSVAPRNLPAPLTDRFCRFDADGTAGSGVLEFAVSRSASYVYRPSDGRD